MWKGGGPISKVQHSCGMCGRLCVHAKIKCKYHKPHRTFNGPWRLLGVRQGTPNAVLLAEAGHSPLWLSWLRRAARLWNKILTELQLQRRHPGSD